MTPEQQRQAAKEQLDLVLSFFPRVDGKLSLVLGVNLAMLALLATTAPPLRTWTMDVLVAAVPALLIGVSIWRIYQGSFPQLEGGRDSLIYFREVASYTEGRYIQSFRDQSEDFRLNDLLSQAWRNAEILRKKFDHLKQAFVLLAWAVVPWVISLLVFASARPNAKSLLGE